MGGLCSIYGEKEVHTGTWWGNLRERHHLEDPGIAGKIMWRCIFRKWDGGGGGEETWTELIWLMIGTVGGLMQERLLTIKLYKVRGIS